MQGVTDYAIYLLDTDGRVTNWNLGAQRIKGYLPNEIIGQHFSQFYTDRRPEIRRAATGAGRPPRGKADLKRKAGAFARTARQFWAHVVIDPIRDDGGRIIGYAKITRDITERRDAQEKLERTREVLVQSQKMEAIGQLTGGIAHDFNNLLMAVLGSLELLRKRLPDDPKIMALLDNAVQGAQRGTSLDQAHARLRAAPGTQAGSDRHSRTRARDDGPPCNDRLARRSRSRPVFRSFSCRYRPTPTSLRWRCSISP